MELDVSGQTITAQQIDYSVSFRTSGGFEFRIEGALTIGDAAGEEVESGSEDDPNTRAAMIGTLTGAALAGASITDAGTLQVALDTGRTLSARADDQFEAWTVAGPEGLKIVCLPGGELAVWSPNGETGPV